MNRRQFLAGVAALAIVPVDGPWRRRSGTHPFTGENIVVYVGSKRMEQGTDYTVSDGMVNLHGEVSKFVGAPVYIVTDNATFKSA